VRRRAGRGRRCDPGWEGDGEGGVGSLSGGGGWYLWAEGDLDGVSEFVDTLEHERTSVDAKLDVFASGHVTELRVACSDLHGTSGLFTSN